MKYNAETLRQKAKELLGQAYTKDNPLIMDDIEKLVEEYNIHKIELELQQDEIYRANQELEEKNRRLDDLFENAPIGYFILNAEGLIIEINSTAAKLFEKPKELLLQKAFTSLVHPSSQDHFYFYWQKIIENKAAGNVEIALSTGRSRPEPFLLNCLPYLDSEKQQWYIRLSATNVSDIKEADVLRDSERRYRLLFKNMINGLLVLKPVVQKDDFTDFLFSGQMPPLNRLPGTTPGKWKVFL
jgi:two-component system, chemotaxis family, sensor kinase Cph1